MVGVGVRHSLRERTERDACAQSAKLTRLQSGEMMRHSSAEFPADASVNLVVQQQRGRLPDCLSHMQKLRINSKQTFLRDILFAILGFPWTDFISVYIVLLAWTIFLFHTCKLSININKLQFTVAFNPFV